MSAAMENLRNDVQKPPEQLEREADSARSAVEGTLAELEHRLSPGEMLDRLMDVVKRHGGEFGDNLLTQVRSNPLPTIIAGVGVAWLMTASKRPPSRGNWQGHGEGERRYGGDAHVDATDRWSSTLDSARDTAVSSADSAKSAAKDALDATSDAAHRAADATGRAAQRAADATRHAADRVASASRASMHSMTEAYGYLWREQPLVLGAIAVAAGAALAALLPSTTAEDSLLGATSDAAKSRLKSEAEVRADGLRGVAEDALKTIKEKVAVDGGNGSEQPRSASDDQQSEPQPAADSSEVS